MNLTYVYTHITITRSRYGTSSLKSSPTSPISPKKKSSSFITKKIGFLCTLSPMIILWHIFHIISFFRSSKKQTHNRIFLEQERKDKQEGWCPHSSLLLLLLTIQRRKLVESWYFSCREAVRKLISWDIPQEEKVYIGTNQPGQSSLCSVNISACADSPSLGVSFPSLIYKLGDKRVNCLGSA